MIRRIPVSLRRAAGRNEDASAVSTCDTKGESMQGTRNVWARAAAFVAVVTAALLLAQPIAASPPQPASGTATVVTTTVTSVRVADGNVIIEATQTGVVTGTFSGTFVEDVRLVQHPSALTTFEGTATLTGTADGCGTGTIPFHLEGQGEGGVFEGKFVTVDHSD